MALVFCLALAGVGASICFCGGDNSSDHLNATKSKEKAGGLGGGSQTPLANKPVTDVTVSDATDYDINSSNGSLDSDDDSDGN